MKFPAGPSGFEAFRILGRGRLDGMPEFLLATARRYGPVASFALARQRFFVLDDPAAIATVLVQCQHDFVKSRGVERLRPLLGTGLLTSEEPLHRVRRRLVQPAFHRQRVEGYARGMQARAEAYVEPWQDGEVREIAPEMMRLALALAAETLFGADLAGEADRIGRALAVALEVFPKTLGPFGEIRERLPLPSTLRFRAARASLDALIGRLVAERRASGEDRGDLLSMLLAARDEGGERLDDRAVRDEALTLLIAGHETTAAALAWTWDFAARNPAVEAELHREVDSVDPLESLRYTRALVSEVMRLRPPAWILGRRAQVPVEIGPWTLPRGGIAILSPYVTHRNPRWWDDPSAFRPERFADGPPAERFAYFPFGGGSRVCIGEGFAWAELVAVVATIARRFRLRAIEAASPQIQPSVTLRVRGPLPMRIERRPRRNPVSQ